MSDALHKLGQRMRQALGDGAAQVDAAQQRRLVTERMGNVRAARRPSLVRWAVVGGLGLSAAGAVAVLVLIQGDPVQPETFECRVEGGARLTAGSWISAGRRAVRLEFSEGSRVRVTPGSRARLARVDGAAVEVAIESGGLRCTVRHADRVRWDFHAGPYQVTVTGTRLGITWKPQGGRIAVAVQAGRVLVRGPGIAKTGMAVDAGQQLRADANRKRVQITSDAQDSELYDQAAPPAADASGSPLDGGGDVEDADHRPLKPVGRQGVTSKDARRWKQLARSGAYTAALEAARRAGLNRLMRRLNPRDLLLLADTARFGGDPELARRLLMAARKRSSAGQAAQLAAFRLGRLFAEQLHDAKSAASWFRVFLREAPRDSLAPDAMGRLMLALVRSGQNEAALEVARIYLRRYPQGNYRTAARSLTEGAARR